MSIGSGGIMAHSPSNTTSHFFECNVDLYNKPRMNDTACSVRDRKPLGSEISRWRDALGPTRLAVIGHGTDHSVPFNQTRKER